MQKLLPLCFFPFSLFAHTGFEGTGKYFFAYFLIVAAVFFLFLKK